MPRSVTTSRSCHFLTASSRPRSGSSAEFITILRVQTRSVVSHVSDSVETSYGAETRSAVTNRGRATQRSDRVLSEARERATDHAGAARTAGRFGDSARDITDTRRTTTPTAP